MRTKVLTMLRVSAIVIFLLWIGLAQAADTIKVGVLHSLSGPMAINETTLKDTILMMVDDLNKRGGLLGKKVEAVVVDPASDWSLFAEKARELIEKEKVDVVFGCWSSISRKAVLPVFEELNGLLFYPIQYEGNESSRNIFYTGATPNQQAIPAVDYLLSEDGGGAKRIMLLGTESAYGRTTNKILRAYLNSKGISDVDIHESYHIYRDDPNEWEYYVEWAKEFASQGNKWVYWVKEKEFVPQGKKKTAIVSTINDGANGLFYKELANQGIKAEEIPVVAISVGEEELAGLDTRLLVGHLAAWNYFMSVDTPENTAFIEKWHAFIKDKKRVTNDPMEAHYIGFKMWEQAVKQAGTTDVDAVRQAMYGQKVKNLSGGTAVMNTNHHLSKPVLIGKIQADGQFETVWQTEGTVVGDPWSDFVHEPSKLTADWTFPWVCGNCEKPKYAPTM